MDSYVCGAAGEKDMTLSVFSNSDGILAILEHFFYKNNVKSIFVNLSLGNIADDYLISSILQVLVGYTITQS